MPLLMIACVLFSSDGPLVLDVPADGAPPQARHSALFVAAPFEVKGGQVRRGAWTSSDEILGEGSTRVIIVASWCPACRKLLERLSGERPRRSAILFLEDENELLLERAVRQRRLTAERARLELRARQEQPLANAGAFEGYPLTLHLLRSGSTLARQITHYPFILACSRTRCTPERARAKGRNLYGQEEDNHYSLQTRPSKDGAAGLAPGIK